MVKPGVDAANRSRADGDPLRLGGQLAADESLLHHAGVHGYVGWIGAADCQVPQVGGIDSGQVEAVGELCREVVRAVEATVGGLLGQSADDRGVCGIGEPICAQGLPVTVQPAGVLEQGSDERLFSPLAEVRGGVGHRQFLAS